MSIVVKTFSNGEVIIKEGDLGKSIFRLVEGNAGVYADYGKKEQFRLAVLKPGDYFGEMALIEEYPRSATVVAECSVKVIEVPENELNSFFAENPDVILELMDHLGNKVKSMTNDYNEAQALLKELSEADAGKKNGLFSKIKKHVNMYQSNKNKTGEPQEESLNDKYSDVTFDESDRVEAYDKGKIICIEGDQDSCLYILHNGKVGLFNNYGERNEVKQDELTPISIFGEMGMLSGAAREYTAVAFADNTYVELIYREDMESVFANNPAKVDMILSFLSQRLRRLNADFLKICKEITETYGD
ncbi:MAG: cyclic nucleotide-binding domain-containing protein [Clostridiales bacterium]|nr:cyclic nucleotide-binding domain-containing protein [Clostridiales bacterium]MBO4579839.1 cyclic nucleotide-binding domain-containing protein [Clostridiales bacterium]